MDGRASGLHWRRPGRDRPAVMRSLDIRQGMAAVLLENRGKFLIVLCQKG
jgi:hypothetical protein